MYSLGHAVLIQARIWTGLMRIGVCESGALYVAKALKRFVPRS